MPPKKRIRSSKRVDDDDDDIVQSNSEIDSEAEAEKAEKAVFPMGRGMSANGAKKPGSAFKDKDVVGWELGGKKRVTISTYRRKTYVGLREYYEKDGRLLPGKKGLNLTIEQYRVFTSLQGEIDKKLEPEEK